MGGVPAMLLCRKHYPNRLWLGITFCALLGAVGHFYIRKGLSYIIAISLITLLLFHFTENIVIHLAASFLCSAVFMVLRFKIDSIRVFEQGG